MDYKKTLNIPKTGFSMRAGLNANSEKYKAFWHDLKLNEQLTNRKGAPIFTLHDGPPYANGNIHLGHALNKVLKDFILRYRSLQGYCIEYIPGWDTHGLPIENKVEITEGYNNSEPLQKRKACREYALEQVENQKQQFLKLNLLTDFSRVYKTLDSQFLDFELQVFYSLLEQNLLFWDLKPVAWSWSSQTALAESEIIYEEVETKSIYFWFPLSEDFKIENYTIKQNTRLLVWTTTPYTLEGNLALALNPDFDYVLIKTSTEEEYILLETELSNLNLEGEILFRFQGKDLKGASYFNPLTKETRPILTGEFVVSGTGTGIVHIAPGYGLDDYYLCLKEEIEVYVSINKEGHFIDNTKFTPINKLFYQRAILVVINWLKEKGYLFKEELIKHSIGHDWRTEKPLLYLASPQWFVNIEDLKPDIHKTFSQPFKTSPAWLEQKLSEQIIKRKEWCLSRQRVWGTPIPILFDEEDNPILDLTQVKHTISILSEKGTDIWFEEEPEYFLHPSLVEKYRDQKLKKSKDILDVWFDSGCSWGILDAQRVADVYLEGFDQIRGWFNSSSITSIALRKCLPFKSLISHGFVLDKDGNKMSKSKGNVIDPLDLIENYGADVVRLWIGLNNYLEDIKISKESLDNAVSLYRKIRNTVFRYSLSVIPEGFSIDEKVLKNLSRAHNIYIYQSFRDAWIQIEHHLENYHFFKALKASLTFLNEYSGWYLEICKDILYCNSKESRGYTEVINVIAEVFDKLLFFFSIFLPQTAEEAWSFYKPNSSSIFLHKWRELSGREYEVDNDKWNKFWKLKDDLYSLVEEIKNKGLVTGPTDVKATIPKDRAIEDLNLVKLLNFAELIIGDELKVEKSSLGVCERCRRHKSTLNSFNLCNRCSNVIEKLPRK